MIKTLLTLSLALSGGAASAQIALPLDTNPAIFVKWAKQAFTQNFLDPGSAQYRNTFVAKSGPLLVLCGEVNGKNSSGAYVGFRGFYQTSDPAFKDIYDPKFPGALEAMRPQVCGQKVLDVE